MHIVHLTTARDFYGGEVCVANLAAGLTSRGHRVTCVVRPDSRLHGVLRDEGMDVLTLPLVDWYEPVSVTRLSRWLRVSRVDVLHTHLPRDWFIAAAASVGAGVRNVGTRHVLQPVSHAPLKRPFLRRFSAMIAVSAAVRRGLLASAVMDAGRIHTVPNGIVAQPPLTGEPSLRSRAGAAADDPVIGAVGRLTADKGVETLLQAVAALRRRWPRLRVFVLGDGAPGSDHPEHLRRVCRRLQLDDAVTFFGYVEDAARRCAEFDIQVVCSRAEPFGLVTLEAMAQGRPLVVTNTGGSPEIVRDGVEGFLVDPYDPALLARRLDCLLDSPGLREEMGRRGRERVARDFGVDRMVAGTEQVYVDACRESVA